MSNGSVLFSNWEVEVPSYSCPIHNLFFHCLIKNLSKEKDLSQFRLGMLWIHWIFSLILIFLENLLIKKFEIKFNSSQNMIKKNQGANPLKLRIRLQSNFAKLYWENRKRERERNCETLYCRNKHSCWSKTENGRLRKWLADHDRNVTSCKGHCLFFYDVDLNFSENFMFLYQKKKRKENSSFRIHLSSNA